MARLGAKVSRSEVSSILKNTFSVGIFWWNHPHTSFLGRIGYMVPSGAKIVLNENFAQFCLKSPLEFVFPKNTFSVRIFAPHLFSWLNGLDGTIGGKSDPVWSFVHPKNTFSIGIFWWKQPHTSLLGLIGYIVCSGAKLFSTKTLLNFASKALSNSFFRKTNFRFEFLF